jgi:hypothetical protein
VPRPAEDVFAKVLLRKELVRRQAFVT